MTAKKTGSRKVMGMLVHGERPQKHHTVADIHFLPKEAADLAQMSCSCGWAGTVGLWADHGGFVSRSWDEDGPRRGKNQYSGPKHSIPATRVFGAAA